jgi:hypothetical protein
MRIFERAPDGYLVVTLGGGEVAMMQMLLAEVRGLVVAAEENEAQKRLFPRVYLDPTEEVAESELQSLVHDDLVKQRVAGFDEIERQLAVGVPDGEFVRLVLDDDQTEQFLRAVNDMRLAIAASLGLDQAANNTEAADPNARAILRWLAELVGDLTDLLHTELPGTN